MRILMYGWEFPPHISGGLGVACFGLTQALVEAGHEVTFVLPDLRGAKPKSHVRLIGANDMLTGRDEIFERWLNRSIPGLDFIRIDSPLRPYLTEASYALIAQEGARHFREKVRSVVGDRGYGMTLSGDYGPNLTSEVFRYTRIAGAIAAVVPHDVIHAHDWLTMLAGVEAKRISGRPLVVHVHALEFDRSGEHVNQEIYNIERHGMEQADRIAAVSLYTKENIVRRYGIAPDKIAVVHNAVLRAPGERPRISHGDRQKKVVLFLGRITFQKGPDYFVEAAAKVLSSRNDVRFVMAGSGDMAPRIIERVAELHIGTKFHFTGFLTGKAVDRMYADSDIYVMPSVSEPFGISPLEAMYQDVPVIISKQSGVSEVLRHALKVDFWDIDGLAAKIHALLDHEPLRRALRTEGQRELEGIQWSRAAEHLTRVYEEIAGAARGEGQGWSM